MRTPAFHALYRWAPWVLAAWLCVLLGTALSPLARAQAGVDALEPVCGTVGMPHWVASPAAQLRGADEGAALLPHGLDCPLCLPLLAPPAVDTPTPLLGGETTSLADRLPASPWVYRVSAPLPARGPPAHVHYS